MSYDTPASLPGPVWGSGSPGRLLLAELDLGLVAPQGFGRRGQESLEREL
jgi:hypothetical protein